MVLMDRWNARDWVIQEKLGATGSSRLKDQGGRIQGPQAQQEVIDGIDGSNGQDGLEPSRRNRNYRSLEALTVKRYRQTKRSLKAQQEVTV
jgi:hypothetical protein